MVASPGGHLDMLRTLKPAVDDRECFWITAAGSRAETLARQEPLVGSLPHWGRNPLQLTRNVYHALHIFARQRPGVVVTSGAGVVVPFCLIARAAGAKLIFSETAARIDDGSLTGRLLSRFASSVLIQWPEARRTYPTATLCRPTLLEEVDDHPPHPGQGTFVAVGTHGQSFDRMLSLVDSAVGAGLLPRPVIAQTGVSRYAPEHYTGTPWLTPDEIRDAVENAEVVVCHGGSGLIGAALAAGRKPLVVPRLRAMQEHIDDHQQQITEKLSELGATVTVEGEIQPAHLDAAREPVRISAIAQGVPSMRDVLRAAIQRSAPIPPTPR